MAILDTPLSTQEKQKMRAQVKIHIKARNGRIVRIKNGTASIEDKKIREKELLKLRLVREGVIY